MAKEVKTRSRIRNSASVPPSECIFCKIVARELPSAIVYEDDEYIAFLDKAPFNEGHTLVCPRKHGETVWDMTEEAIGGLFALAAKISRAVVEATGTDGFRFVQNNGEAANQAVAHVHVHVIPVKLAHKGQWMDRKVIEPDEMNLIAERIRSALKKL